MTAEINRWFGKLEKAKLGVWSKIDVGDFSTVDFLNHNRNRFSVIAEYFLQLFPVGFQINEQNTYSNGNFQICIYSVEQTVKLRGVFDRNDCCVILGRINKITEP